jgi:hypothetical protein
MEGALMNDVESLRRCPDCGCSFCCELNACELARDLWRVAFVCPNCGKTWSRLLDLQALTAIDRALDEDTRVLVAELRIFEQVNMAMEIQRFIDALGADAILPMDF